MAVAGKFSDGGLLAAGNPTLRLAVGNNYSVGDWVVCQVIHNTNAVPGAVTDSLGNTYRLLNGRGAVDYSNLDANGNPTPLPLGFALYGCQVTVAGTRPTLTFTLGATGMAGIRGYTGVNLGTDPRGHPLAPSSSTIDDRTSSPFIIDPDAQSVGDLVMACIVALSGSVTFSTDPFQTPGWSIVRTFSGNGLSLQLLEQVPAAPGSFIAAWDTNPATVTAVISAIGLPHA